MVKATQPNKQSESGNIEASGGSLRQLLNNQSICQFIKYVITGLVSFATEISLFYLFTEVLHIWYIFSNSAALLIVFIINFSMNRFWAFRSRQPFMKQFITSGLLFALNLVVGNAIIYFFIDIVHLPDLLCWVPENFGKLVPKVIATGMAVTWNFFLYKYYIYK